MSAEAYAALSHLVDDNAQELDQDVRPRVRAGAAISSRHYLIALAEQERVKVSFNTAIEVAALFAKTGDEIDVADESVCHPDISSSACCPLAAWDSTPWDDRLCHRLHRA
jgi:hypothetical protein